MKEHGNLKALFLALVSALAAGAAAQEAGSAKVETILRQIDAGNRFAESYTAILRVASHEPDGPTSLTSYRMYAKGPRKILLVYLEPSKDLGKKIAMNGDSYWFYFPRAGRSMLIRPVSTLTGSIAVGDMIGQPLLELYVFAGSEESGDGGTRLSFTARGKASPYGRVVYEYRDDRIVSQSCYTRSGLLLKVVTFVAYTEGRDGPYATKMVVRNAVYPDYYSLIEVSALAAVPSIPDFWFTPEGLPDAGGSAR
jgi:outer membrane lipoprotein-sorting protein